MGLNKPRFMSALSLCELKWAWVAGLSNPSLDIKRRVHIRCRSSCSKSIFIGSIVPRNAVTPVAIFAKKDLTPLFALNRVTMHVTESYEF